VLTARPATASPTTETVVPQVRHGRARDAHGRSGALVVSAAEYDRALAVIMNWPESGENALIVTAALVFAG
jgi:hypothetical protein